MNMMTNMRHISHKTNKHETSLPSLLEQATGPKNLKSLSLCRRACFPLRPLQLARSRLFRRSFSLSWPVGVEPKPVNVVQPRRSNVINQGEGSATLDQRVN